MSSLTWSYGVTTVPSRIDSLLPDTLRSLQNAGYPSPRLFVDGAYEHQVPEEYSHLEVTCRYPRVRVAANWMMSMLELYLRNPKADRYCIFQDDILLVKNLRTYLDACFPEPDSMKQVYLNLYQVLGNRALAMQQPHDGWFKANQLGKGALALVFDNEGVRTLLASPHMTNRVHECETMGWRSVDGGISEALCRKAAHTPHECNLAPEGHTAACVRGRYVELCHRPGLVQHQGVVSAVDKRKNATTHEEGHPEYRWDITAVCEDFPGENWDPIEDGKLVGNSANSTGDGRSLRGVSIPTEEWERERQAILDAIAGDEERLRTSPGRESHFKRVIAGYKTRLRDWELKKPVEP